MYFMADLVIKSDKVNEKVNEKVRCTSCTEVSCFFNKLMEKSFMDNVTVLPQTSQVLINFTRIRDRRTKRSEFREASKHLISELFNMALNTLPITTKKVVTRVGEKFYGIESDYKVCIVPILRAGKSMQSLAEEKYKSIKVFDTLIQRDEVTSKPVAFKSWYTPDILNRKVILFDPMLATGGSALSAINDLIDYGVKESNIIFVNLVSCPEGLSNINIKYPNLKIITGHVDGGLNKNNYIIKYGLGDFGDLYYGTDNGYDLIRYILDDAKIKEKYKISDIKEDLFIDDCLKIQHGLYDQYQILMENKNRNWREDIKLAELKRQLKDPKFVYEQALKKSEWYKD